MLLDSNIIIYSAQPENQFLRRLTEFAHHMDDILVFLQDVLMPRKLEAHLDDGFPSRAGRPAAADQGEASRSAQGLYWSHKGVQIVPSQAVDWIGRVCPSRRPRSSHPPTALARDNAGISLMPEGPSLSLLPEPLETVRELRTCATLVCELWMPIRTIAHRGFCARHNYRSHISSAVTGKWSEVPIGQAREARTCQPWSAKM